MGSATKRASPGNAGDTLEAAEVLVMTRMAGRDTADLEADELLRGLYQDVKDVEGSKRTGPDLHREGGVRGNSWHYLHLVDPRSTSPNSTYASASP